MKTCYQESIKLLAKRDYSVPKLTEKLKTKGFTLVEIEAVIQTLIEKRYLREDEYIRARVKAFIRKGYSKKHIELKLRQEGLNNTVEIINEQFNELGVSEKDQVERLIAKKRENDPLRLKRFLMSKGHFYEDY